MSRIFAAVNGGPTSGPVLDVADGLGRRLGAEVDGISIGVAEYGGPGRSRVRTEPGAPEALIPRHAAEPDVVAVVIGARSTRIGAWPVGHVTLAVITHSSVPVVVVPPDLSQAQRGLGCLVVPLEGDRRLLAPTRGLVVALESAGTKLHPLHVMDRLHTPPFWEGWRDRSWYAEEFSQRVEPGFPETEIAPGDVVEVVVQAVRNHDADGVVLEWKQHWDPGRAEVVRRLLERATVPVILVPEEADHSEEADDAHST